MENTKPVSPPPEGSAVSERRQPNAGPELFFGLVGATGTDLTLVAEHLVEALALVNYQCELVKLIKLVEAFPEWSALPSFPEDKRIRARMDAGDAFRSKLGIGSALARLALGRVRDFRQGRTGDPLTAEGGRAYIFHSLKRKEEVQLFRTIYGPNFFLIGAFAPRNERVGRLASRIASSHYATNSDAFRDEAERLVQRDLDDHSKPLGQSVGSTIALADVFVDIRDPAALRRALTRFIKLLFGCTFHTPTRDEFGMFHAHAAALRSASLARQVGSALAAPDGAIVAVGANEVPKAGGGLYWEDDEPDHRDHVEGYDPSDRIRRTIVAEALQQLIAAGWLNDSKKDVPVPELVTAALDRNTLPPILRETQVMRVIEYGRAVHAEMAAIVDAASRGAAVRDCTLYVTTYPCHLCAKHIIAAGIRRVVYVEPYPKSLTSELHRDAMVNDATVNGLVSFDAFVGLAPRRYMQFFEMTKRKDDETGEMIPWDRNTALPRGATPLPFYLANELDDWRLFVAKLEASGIIPNRGGDDA